MTNQTLKRRAGRVPFDVRAALLRDTERVLALLAAEPALNDESIHRIRQVLKRARAALRLLRDAVSEEAYAEENARLRDAARPLAPARDAAVMLGVLEEMIAGRKMRRYRPDLGRLRAELRRAHARSVAAVRAEVSIARIRALLEQSRERTAHWRLPRDPEPVYRSGIRRIYRRGRRTLKTALAQGSAEALHEWRKHVKYLALAMALVAPAKSRAAKAGKTADELARRAGDDHDLAMLASELRRVSADRALIAKLGQRRRRLQKRALKLGGRLYKQAPRRFAAMLKDIKADRSTA